MKKLILISVFLLAVISFINKTNAQNVNININIKDEPACGSLVENCVSYYYFPDINCYYDVNNCLFVYSNYGRWISARYLPYYYRNYDLNSMYKVVLNTSKPWLNNHNHCIIYAKYKDDHRQVVIHDCRNRRYHNNHKNNAVRRSSHRHDRPSHKNKARNSRSNNCPNNRPPIKNNNGSGNSNGIIIRNNQNNKSNKNDLDTARPDNSNNSYFVKTNQNNIDINTMDRYPL